MVKITLVFLNNGDAVAKFENDVYTFIHNYHNMQDLAFDYYSIVGNKIHPLDIADFENNTPEIWNNDHSGCYVYEGTDDESIDDVLKELNIDWGRNVERFAIAVSIIHNASYDIALIEKYDTDGLSKKEIAHLYDIVKSDNLYPIEYYIPDKHSSAMGFITKEAAAVLDFAYDNISILSDFIRLAITTDKDSFEFKHLRIKIEHDM